MHAPTIDRPLPPSAARPRGRLRAPAWTVQVALYGLILAACWVRAGWLPSTPGTMGRDESRLALAALGILEHGIPHLPDGFVYTRGLLPAYLEAASIALLGFTDQAARLPSLIFGTLLVPATFALGRLAGPPWAALAAAAIVAFSPPLVLQAREAWLYSSLLFWFAIALAWLLRDGPGDRWRAGLAAVAALLSHELAVLLVPIAALLDLARVAGPRRRAEAPAWRRVVPFWALLLGGVALVGALSLALRAPTAGGPTVELREYLRPPADLLGLRLTLAHFGGWHAWLLPAAVLGLPYTRRGLRAALARPERLAAPVAVLAVILFNAFGLVMRGESRYALLALPPLAVAATTGLARVGPSLVAALGGLALGGSALVAATNAGAAHGPSMLGVGRLGRGAHVLVGGGLLLALVALSVDPARLLAEARARDLAETWVQSLADRRPDDLVMSFAPTLTMRYLGRTDFWLRSEGYEKYVWANRRVLRDVHTGAVVVRNAAELESLVARQNRGSTLWVVLAIDPSRETSRPTREVGAALLARAAEVRRPPDGRVVLRVVL